MSNLLSNVKMIVDNEKRLEIIKGERFNVYSILGMERRETKTHSAFIGELLNPLGTHHKGSVFLEHFCACIGEKNLDPNSSRVFIEHSIGRINTNQEGGQIDIFILDKNGNAISIENKIDAGDQENQILRYYNYRNGSNQVYYLTLDGSLPSKNSMGSLVPGQDFFIISYKEEIIQWLTLCLKESHDAPILRESIRQYLVLIKKITNSMEREAEEQLIKVILNNYEEAVFIAENIQKARHLIADEIRTVVFERLNESLKSDFILELGNPVSSANSQIWIRHRDFSNRELFFGIESFSGQGWNNGQLLVGVFNSGPERSLFASVKGNSNTNKWWVDKKDLLPYEGFNINFSDGSTLKKLHNDKSFKEEFVTNICQQIEEYIASKSVELLEFFNSSRN